jgi:Flp pilus assembly protein TadG
MRNLLKSIYRNKEATTAVEFAIVAPLFILLVFGTIGLAFVLYLVASLHFAVEDGARCAAVRSTWQCMDSTSTIAYTQSRYMGPNVSPTFTYDVRATCGGAGAGGSSVTGTVTYSWNIGFTTFVTPISASACYPNQTQPTATPS